MMIDKDKEPVAWMWEGFNPFEDKWKTVVGKKLPTYDYRNETKLYTHPAKTLSDVEIDKIYFKIYETYSSQIDIDFARAIEKEMTNGNENT